MANVVSLAERTNNARFVSVEQMLETDSPLLFAYCLMKQHRAGLIWYDYFSKRTLT